MKKRNQEIDWDERERELIDLCDRYRKNDGTYDCIVEDSGGKDGAIQSHLLKNRKYGMHPLTVNYLHLYHRYWWKNFQIGFIKGVLIIFIYPNGHIHRLQQNATLNLLHPFQPFILGQKTFVTKMAVKLDIPLMFYGEMQNMVKKYLMKLLHILLLDKMLKALDLL